MVRGRSVGAYPSEEGLREIENPTKPFLTRSCQSLHKVILFRRKNNTFPSQRYRKLG